jgi:hypothetical protein
MNKIPQFSNKTVTATVTTKKKKKKKGFTIKTVTATVICNEKLRNIELSLQQYNSFEQISFQK